MESNRPTGVEVVERVAEREGVDPNELDPPLYAVLGPEATDRLFDWSSDTVDGADVTLEFEYAGYEVTVEGDDVTVEEAGPIVEKPSGRIEWVE